MFLNHYYSRFSETKKAGGNTQHEKASRSRIHGKVLSGKFYHVPFTKGNDIEVGTNDLSKDGFLI
jgi:hypothetical protein